jgi:hypothetical protein
VKSASPTCRADDLKGVYISANLEVRVAFDNPLFEGKTFIAHMKEDEVEVV